MFFKTITKLYIKKEFGFYFIRNLILNHSHGPRRYFPGNRLLDSQLWPIYLKGAGIQNSSRSMTCTKNERGHTSTTFQSRKRLYNHICLFVRSSVCKTHQQLEIIILHHSSFITHHSSFILPSFRDF